MCYNKCPNGTYLSNSNQCSLCPVGCLICSNNTFCNDCASNYILIPELYSCSICPFSSYLNNSNCLTCPNNCLTCNS